MTTDQSATSSPGPSPGTSPGTDFRGSRRLTGAEEWFWYLLAAISYILTGMWHKWLLNWILGPLWLVTIICIGPPILDRIRAMISGRRLDRGGDAR